MQEVFSKIIERLEELHERYIKQYGVVGGNPMAFAVNECIDIVELIVNQEAEKFGTDTNVGSNDWIPCSERLPEKKGKYLTTSKIYFVPDHVDEPDNYIGLEITYYSEINGWNGEVIAWQPLPEPYQPKGE